MKRNNTASIGTTLTLLTSMLCLSVLPATAQEGPEDTRFHPGQWEISPFATYVDKTGDDWGLGASGTYFITKMIGVGATTYWTDFKGAFIDNLAAEATVRIPLLKVVAPYAVGSLGYEFETDEWFQTLGGGVDFRPFKNMSAFSDLQYRFADKTKDGIFLRLGVRFNF